MIVQVYDAEGEQYALFATTRDDEEVHNDIADAFAMVKAELDREEVVECDGDDILNEVEAILEKKDIERVYVTELYI